MRRGRLFGLMAAVVVMGMVFALVAGCGGKDEPTISSISPSSGEPGAEVTIEGSYFGSEQKDSSVEFGKVSADIKSWSDSKIEAKVPSGLDEGEYVVTVVTAAGSSEGVDFELGKGKTTEKHEERKSGQVEHDTPAAAILEFCKKEGIDTTGWTFGVVSVSKSDPTWKIDKGIENGAVTDEFLLHQQGGKWTVVAYAKSFTEDDLKKYGAPSDLLSPEPQPKPDAQTQAILNYLQSQGYQTNDWKFNLVKVSSTDSNWEVIKGTEISTGKTLEFMLIWNNMAGAWEVLSDAGPPWTGVEFKGEAVPDDLKNI